MNKDIQILYEDEQILVCEKPAGVPVQTAGYRTKDLVSLMKNHLAREHPGTGEPYLGVVHRLDQPVQGVVVFGKTQKAAASLSAQFSGQTGKKQAEKIYLAVVQKNSDTSLECGKEKELTNFLLKDGKTNMSHIVPKGTKGAKEARLSCQILKEQEQEALLRIQLFTGRHHQIRVQLAGAGMPLVGDLKYGNSEEKDGRNGLALCAAELRFLHPQTGKQVQFDCIPKGRAFELFERNYSAGLHIHCTDRKKVTQE